MAIIGDSISTYSGTSPTSYEVRQITYYPVEDVNSVDKMWWKIVADEIDATVVNCSWSSSRVTGKPKGIDAFAACSDKRIWDVGRYGTPEIIMCFIGCNDWGNEIPLGTWSAGDPIPDDSGYSQNDQLLEFKKAYALMLNKLKTAYPSSTIYACTLLDDSSSRDETPGAPSDNADGVTIPQYNLAIKEVAQAMNVDVLDIHECAANYASSATYFREGLHPNAAGQAAIANYIINTLSN